MTPEEINIACAERMEKWKDLRSILFQQGWMHPDGSVTTGGCDYNKVPNFHGSMDAAMQLVEKAKEMDFICTMDNDIHWACAFNRYIRATDKLDTVEVESHSLSAAICEAFLKLPLQ